MSPSLLFFASVQEEECLDRLGRSGWSLGQLLVVRAAVTPNQEPGRLLPAQLPSLLSKPSSSYCLSLEHIWSRLRATF